MQNWKKNLIAGAILVTVCGGIYLNWLYTEDQATGNFSDTLNADKLLSDDLTVMGTEGEADAAVSTSTDYFAAVRLSRRRKKYFWPISKKNTPPQRTNTNSLIRRVMEFLNSFNISVFFHSFFVRAW